MKNYELIKVLKNSIKPNKNACITESALIIDGEIITTDLSNFLCQKVDIEGTFLIDTKRVLKICMKLPKESSIELKEGEKIELWIDGKAKFFFAKEDIEDFPVLPTKTDYLGTLKDAENIKSCLPFTSNDELRPALMCVNVSDQIQSRTGHIGRFIESNSIFKNSFLIHRNVIPFLQNINYEVSRATTKTHDYISLNANDHRIFYHEIDETFPDLKKVIPESTKLSSVNKKEFISQINLAMLAANQTTHQVNFEFKENNQIEVVSCDLDFSTEYKDSFESFATNINESFKIGVNGKLLLEVLKAVKIDTVQIGMSEPGRAILIEENNLIMPILINPYNYE